MIQNHQGLDVESAVGIDWDIAAVEEVKHIEVGLQAADKLAVDIAVEAELAVPGVDIVELVGRIAAVEAGHTELVAEAGPEVDIDWLKEVGFGHIEAGELEALGVAVDIVDFGYYHIGRPGHHHYPVHPLSYRQSIQNR